MSDNTPLLRTSSFTSHKRRCSSRYRFQFIGLCAVCIAAIPITNSLFDHYLDITPVNRINPVKLVAKVLCYARKHKYPENRSALTYWEEEAPSRLDLGKGKYGGPFTEEEVEDVKTFLRLLPLVIVPTLATAFNEQNIEIMEPELYGCYDLLEEFLSFNAT